ncbi:MAG: aminotransferase class III-fold pyridoxal phosphate-dependent enzyme [Microthrixaceae bacterium]
MASRPAPIRVGLTYSGHPLACAAAVESMRIRGQHPGERAARLGEEVIGSRLEKLRENHPSVGEVRGLGCFFAIELVRTAEREMRLCLPTPPERRPLSMNEVLFGDPFRRGLALRRTTGSTWPHRS